MIFSKIRIAYGEQLEKFKPLLRKAYQCIYHYQLDRTPDNELQMRKAIHATTEMLEFFANYLPYSKSKYIFALKRLGRV